MGLILEGTKGLSPGGRKSVLREIYSKNVPACSILSRTDTVGIVGMVEVCRDSTSNIYRKIKIYLITFVSAPTFK
jgi:hypothetical protein